VPSIGHYVFVRKITEPGNTAAQHGERRTTAVGKARIVWSEIVVAVN
jgi:hypothetical protein